MTDFFAQLGLECGLRGPSLPFSQDPCGLFTTSLKLSVAFDSVSLKQTQGATLHLTPQWMYRYFATKFAFLLLNPCFLVSLLPACLLLDFIFFQFLSRHFRKLNTVMCINSLNVNYYTENKHIKSFKNQCFYFIGNT